MFIQLRCRELKEGKENWSSDSPSAGLRLFLEVVSRWILRKLTPTCRRLIVEPRNLGTTQDLRCGSAVGSSR
jgi:hypothetical protein